MIILDKENLERKAKEKDKEESKIKISYYSKCNNPKEQTTKDLREVIELIKKDPKIKKDCEYLRGEKDKSIRSKYKINHLSSVTLAGEFSHRSKKGLIKSSGLACLDIDIYNKDLTELKQEINKNPCVALSFISPSGGLKVVVRIPVVKTAEEYDKSYLELLDEFKKYEPKQDTSTKDISRLCFLSHDPNIYVNDQAKEFIVLKKEKRSLNEEFKRAEQNYNEKVIIKTKEFSNGLIAKECRFIEDIACKITLDSNELPRHTYLDPNVYVYLKYHKKEKLLEEYKQTQGREDSAFNDSKTWKFSCDVLRKYISKSKGEGIEQAKILCVNCPFLKKIKSKQAKEFKAEEDEEEDNTIYTSSYINEERSIIVEQVYNAKNNISQFCIYNTETKKITYKDSLEIDDLIYKPLHGEEIEKGVVSLPSVALEYNNDKELDASIIKFINTWLDVGAETLLFAKWNVKRSWVYQRFTSLNYLRALGHYGDGKSRYLNTLGLLHYKPIKTSGATTTAPLFRIIEKWKGTLVMDEADFDNSDESNEIIKIINLGFETGNNIMRCDQNDAKKLNFFDPYSPKIIATRREFKDKATESRCITEHMRGTERLDIPVNLNEDFFKDSLKLRNKLLMWRFKNYYQIDLNKKVDININDVEPRIRQIVSSLIPLFNAADDLEVFKEFITKKQEEIIDQRQNSYEGQIVKGLYNLVLVGQENISAKDIIESADIKNKNGFLVKPQSISSSMKMLGFGKAKLKRIGEDVKKCYDLNKNMLDLLYVKYGFKDKSVTSVTFVTVYGESMTQGYIIDKFVNWGVRLPYNKKIVDVRYNGYKGYKVTKEEPLIIEETIKEREPKEPIKPLKVEQIILNLLDPKDTIMDISELIIEVNKQTTISAYHFKPKLNNLTKQGLIIETEKGYKLNYN